MPENKDRGPEFLRQQQSLNEERLKIDREKLPRGTWVIEGDDLIKEVNEAEIEGLPGVIDEVLCFREGLIFGKDNYDFEKKDEKKDKDTLIFLRDLFNSVENSIERPYPLYLDSAVTQRLGEEIRKVKKKARSENRELNNNEEAGIEKLTALRNHYFSRQLIDKAFRQRQLTVDVAEQGAELVGRAPDQSLTIKLDKGHWESVFQGEFGLKVDKVLRKIVEFGRGQSPQEKFKKLGIKSNLYAEGFKNDEIFQVFLSDLLKEANGQMDAVWFAWRLALIWEIPSTIAIGKEAATSLEAARIGKEKDTEGAAICNAPIGNDLYDWLAHFEEKRISEFGYSLDGKRVQIGKNLTHTGYPLSLGKICSPTMGEEVVKGKDGKLKKIIYDVVDFPKNIKQLCLSYLHESKINIKIKTGKKDSAGNDKYEVKRSTLWEEWWGEKGVGKRLGGDPEGNNIDWSLTEVLDPTDLETESLMTGSFGYWLLKRARAWKIVEDIRSRPGFHGKENIADSDFFAQRVRIWDKVLGKIKENTPPEKNPRTWWVAGIILHSHNSKTENITLARDNYDKVYRTYVNSEKWGTDMAGSTTSKKPNIAEIFNHAFQCGFLRKIDIDWLSVKLNIPRTIFGDEATRI